MIDLRRTPGLMNKIDGFTRPNWRAVADWIDANLAPGARQDAWVSAQRQWLNWITHYFSPGYRVLESPNVILLSAYQRLDASHLLQEAEKLIKIIQQYLPGLATERARKGKYPVLLLRTPQDYAKYVEYYATGEKDLKSSIGVCISDVLVHVAVATYTGVVRSTLVHELTHACLKPIAMPRWLEEGITQRMQRVFAGGDYRSVFDPPTEHQRSYWLQQGLGRFFSGESFSDKNARHFSYRLSELMLQAIIEEEPQGLWQFIQASSCQDGGEAAARSCFGKALGHYATRILGQGPWAAEAPSVE